MRSLLAVLVLLATLGSAELPTYVASPEATERAKADLAAGHEPAHGYPELIRVEWTTQHVKPGSLFEAVVTTSPNVVFVGGRYKQWTFPFGRIGPNRYKISYKVPFLPPFLIGTWPLDVFARTEDGIEIHRSYEFTYSYG